MSNKSSGSMAYIVLCGQIFGNTESGFQVEYGWDGNKFATRDEAKKHGFTIRESDDFNIGVIQGRKLIWFGWMEKQDDTMDLDELTKKLYL